MSDIDVSGSFESESSSLSSRFSLQVVRSTSESTSASSSHSSSPLAFKCTNDNNGSNGDMKEFEDGARGLDSLMTAQTHFQEFPTVKKPKTQEVRNELIQLASGCVMDVEEYTQEVTSNNHEKATVMSDSTMLSRSPVKQDAIVLSAYSSQYFHVMHDPPSLNVSPVDRIQWWIEFVRLNYSKLDHHNTEFFMSSFSKLEDACLTLQRFLPNQASLSDSWLNDRIVWYVMRLLFLNMEEIYVVDPLEIENAYMCGSSLIEYNPAAKLVCLPCHYETHWRLIVVDIELQMFTLYNTSRSLDVRTQFVYDFFLKRLPRLRLNYEEVRVF